MVNFMDIIKTHANDLPRTDWQILGELELTVGNASDHTMNKWLKVVLGLLELHADFVNKVLRSAQDSTAHILQVASESRYEHIHLLVFVKFGQNSKGQTWGFFRVEKLKDTPTAISPDHAVEFYLYPEG